MSHFVCCLEYKFFTEYYYGLLLLVGRVIMLLCIVYCFMSTQIFLVLRFLVYIYIYMLMFYTIRSFIVRSQHNKCQAPYLAPSA